MAYEPDEYGLPAFLDPVFDWLAVKLSPGIVDNVIIPGLTHTVAFSRSLYDVLLHLMSSRPATWDVEKILPPLITLFGAYLALLSFYRTTSWMLRTTVWFMKWGTMFGALMGGIGYLAGQEGGGDLVQGIRNLASSGATGMAKSVGAAVWEMINTPGNENQSGGRRTRKKTSTTSASDRKTRPGTQSSKDKNGGKNTKGKSKSDSYEDNRGPMSGGQDAQKIMGQIVGFAEKMGWMGAIRDAVGNTGQRSDDEESASSSRNRHGRS